MVIGPLILVCTVVAIIVVIVVIGWLNVLVKHGDCTCCPGTYF